jgi:hypothetical protein
MPTRLANMRTYELQKLGFTVMCQLLFSYHNASFSSLFRFVFLHPPKKMTLGHFHVLSSYWHSEAARSAASVHLAPHLHIMAKVATCMKERTKMARFSCSVSRKLVD